MPLTERPGKPGSSESRWLGNRDHMGVASRARNSCPYPPPRNVPFESAGVSSRSFGFAATRDRCLARVCLGSSLVEHEVLCWTLRGCVRRHRGCNDSATTASVGVSGTVRQRPIDRVWAGRTAVRFLSVGGLKPYGCRTSVGTAPRFAAVAARWFGTSLARADRSTRQPRPSN
jgi:hypothetical protein